MKWSPPLFLCYRDMMRNCLIGLVLSVVLGACGVEECTRFKVVFPVGEKRKVELETVEGGRRAIVFEVKDSIREGVMVLPLSRGVFARLWVGDMPYTVWMRPGKPWCATFMWNEWLFEGEDVDVNGYLNTSRGLQMYFTDYYRIPNKEFRTKLEIVSSEKANTLQNAALDVEFVEQEAKRLRFIRDRHVACGVVYGEIKDWNENLRENTMQVLREGLREDSLSWGIPEYREMIDKSLMALAKLEGAGKSGHDLVLEVVNRVVENYKDKRLVEYVVNRNVLEYVKNVGVENAEELDRVFREHVRDTGLVAAYDKVYVTGRKLMKGQPAVPFTFKDVEGNEVSLSDFKGRYVYIDLWATWCGPCVAEIPHLKKLEEHFRGRNICFVSISSDKKWETWEKYVREREMEGVQLHMGKDEKYMKEIHCEGIPRFLLIDRDGNFINANMTRPSDVRTREVLEGLEGV